MGKGSDPRPVDRKVYSANFVAIFGDKDPLYYQRDKSKSEEPPKEEQKKEQ